MFLLFFVRDCARVCGFIVCVFSGFFLVCFYCFCVCVFVRSNALIYRSFARSVVCWLSCLFVCLLGNFICLVLYFVYMFMCVVCVFGGSCISSRVRLVVRLCGLRMRVCLFVRALVCCVRGCLFACLFRSVVCLFDLFFVVCLFACSLSCVVCLFVFACGGVFVRVYVRL